MDNTILVNSYTVLRSKAWVYLGCTKKYGEKLIIDAGLGHKKELLISEVIGLRTMREMERYCSTAESPEVRTKAVQLVRDYLATHQLTEEVSLYYDVPYRTPSSLQVGTEAELGFATSLSLLTFGLELFIEKLLN